MTYGAYQVLHFSAKWFPLVIFAGFLVVAPTVHMAADFFGKRKDIDFPLSLGDRVRYLVLPLVGFALIGMGVSAPYLIFEVRYLPSGQVALVEKPVESHGTSVQPSNE